MPSKEPEGSSQQADLDDLLDDALNDFETDQPAETSGRASSSSSAAAQPDKPGPRQSKGKGLAFDPLPKPKSKRANPHAQRAAAAAAGPFDAFGGFAAIPPDIADQDELSAGFQRMMAEIAQVDLTQGQPAHPVAEPVMPGDHDLAATLRALAANSNTFGADQSPQSRAFHPNASEDDMLARLSEQLNALGQEAARMPGGGVQLPGGGEGSPEDMSGLVDGIMHELLSKDVLYQPLQEIGLRYPKWLADHRQQLSPEDLERYSQQYMYTQQIITLYDEEPNNFPKLIDLLQRMQACGTPPQEIIDEMVPVDAQGRPQLPGGLGGLGSLGGLGGLGSLTSLGLSGLGNSGGGGGGSCCIQ